MCRDFDVDTSKDYPTIEPSSDYSEVAESNISIPNTDGESGWQDLMDDAIDFVSTFSDTFSNREESEERNEESSAFTSSIESSDDDD